MADRNDDRSSGAGGPCPYENVFGQSDVGRQRQTNQDQFLVAQLNKSMRVSSTSLPLDTQSRLFGRIQGLVLLVADGMGGHAAGEKASTLAVDHLIKELLNSVHWFFHDQKDGEARFIDNLKKLLQDAHTRILYESSQHDSQRGMGTTLTMAHLVWPRMYVVHAGDSRCYLIRDGAAKPVTNDHTLARQLVESGGLKPEDEAASKWSNVLWNVLGGRAGGQLIAEVYRIDLQIGDSIVVCSDGLHRYVGNEQLAKIVTGSASSEAACRSLIDVANEAGGEDNITVIVSKPEQDPNAHPYFGGHSTWNEESGTIVPDTDFETTDE